MRGGDPIEFLQRLDGCGTTDQFDLGQRALFRAAILRYERCQGEARPIRLRRRVQCRKRRPVHPENLAGRPRGLLARQRGHACSCGNDNVLQRVRVPVCDIVREVRPLQLEDRFERRRNPIRMTVYDASQHAKRVVETLRAQQRLECVHALGRVGQPVSRQLRLEADALQQPQPLVFQRELGASRRLELSARHRAKYAYCK